MFIGLLFAMLSIACIIVLIWGFRVTPPPVPAHVSLFLIVVFILVELLGWQVFGPLLRGPNSHETDVRIIRDK